MGRGAMALAAIVLLAGCFDVQKVNPERTEIVWPVVQRVDDFERGRGWPTWTAFGGWTCYSWPAPGFCSPTGACFCADAQPGLGIDAQPGPGSAHGGYLEFDLHNPDPNNGAGAFLQTAAVHTPVDLSRYAELAFTARFDLTEGSVPADFALRVTLSCKGASATPVPADVEPVGVASAVALVPDGLPHRFALDLSEFTQLSYQYEQARLEQIDRGLCLSLVSALRFSVQVDKGASIKGKLTLDDIELYERLRDGLRFSPWSSCSSPAGSTQFSCIQTNGAPTMSFALEHAPGEEVGTKMLLAASPVRLDATHLEVDPLDLRVFQKLRFKAELTPGATSAQQGRRITVGLACNGLEQNFAVVQREVQFEPGWSSYALPLANFLVPKYVPYRISMTADDCLGQVDGLSFEVDPPVGEAAIGTLTIGNAAFE